MPARLEVRREMIRNLHGNLHHSILTGRLFSSDHACFLPFGQQGLLICNPVYDRGFLLGIMGL